MQGIDDKIEKLRKNALFRKHNVFNDVHSVLKRYMKNLCKEMIDDEYMFVKHPMRNRIIYTNELHINVRKEYAHAITHFIGDISWHVDEFSNSPGFQIRIKISNDVPYYSEDHTIRLSFETEDILQDTRFLFWKFKEIDPELITVALDDRRDDMIKYLNEIKTSFKRKWS